MKKKPPATTLGSEEAADGQTQPSTTALPEDPPTASLDTSAEELRRKEGEKEAELEDPQMTSTEQAV